VTDPILSGLTFTENRMNQESRKKGKRN